VRTVALRRRRHHTEYPRGRYSLQGWPGFCAPLDGTGTSPAL